MDEYDRAFTAFGLSDDPCDIRLPRRSADVKRLLLALVCLVGLGLVRDAAASELDRIVSAENKAADVALAALPVVDDAAFLRRIYVDLIGRIPTEGEVREFAASPAKTRRNDLIDKLL